MSDQVEHGGLSERDRDLRKSGIAGLAVMELLVEGKAEHREAELIKKLRDLSTQVLENGVKDMMSLPYINNQMTKEQLAKLLKLNPQYVSEYVAGIFRYVAEQFLETKPLNMKDLEFTLSDQATRADVENMDVSPLAPENLHETQKNAINIRVQVVAAINFLVFFGVISREEFKQVRDSM